MEEWLKKEPCGWASEPGGAWCRPGLRPEGAVLSCALRPGLKSSQNHWSVLSRSINDHVYILKGRSNCRWWTEWRGAEEAPCAEVQAGGLHNALQCWLCPVCLWDPFCLLCLCGRQPVSYLARRTPTFIKHFPSSWFESGRQLTTSHSQWFTFLWRQGAVPLIFVFPIEASSEM